MVVLKAATPDVHWLRATLGKVGWWQKTTWLDAAAFSMFSLALRCALALSEKMRPGCIYIIYRIRLDSARRPSHNNSSSAAGHGLDQLFGGEWWIDRAGSARPDRTF